MSLTKVHGQPVRATSLQPGQNPVNLLLNPAQNPSGRPRIRGAGLTEVATQSSQLTGAPQGSHTRNEGDWASGNLMATTPTKPTIEVGAGLGAARMITS